MALGEQRSGRRIRMITMATVQRQQQAFVGGAGHKPASGEYFETCNPANGEVIAEVARGGAEDVDIAVHDSKRAFREWAGLVPSERGRMLMELARELRSKSDELASLESLDNGKPLTQARADVEIAARYFEFYAGAADKINGETIPLGSSYHAYTVREPYGVTGHIVPWNAPIQQAARGVAPALAAGNTAVVKPAEDTPLSCLALAQLAAQCGIPPGVLNVVPGYGEEAGSALASHDDVRKIAFTGSVETGGKVMHAAADRLVPITLELGGKSPNIVFADADLDGAARSSMWAINMNAGQVCAAGSRLLVQDEVYDEMVERTVALDSEVELGPGLEDPDMGPLTTQDQFDRVRKYLEVGREEGAILAFGGGLPDDDRLRGGFFVEPTIFADVDNRMRIAQEEIFGPVLSILRFGDEDEAIHVGNDTNFGLVAGIWTRDVSRAHRVAAQLEAGQVFVNEWFAGGIETPFGGVKKSGFGREKGVEAIAHYTHTKTVAVRL